MSHIDAPRPAATQPVEPKKASPIRLIVLLGILAIVLGAFLVDMFVMYDSVNAAVVRLNDADREASARAFDKDNPNSLSREGVEQAIGFKPTTSKVENGKLVEHYRWWGSLPLERRFIMVTYDDEQGKKYSQSEVSNRTIFGEDEDADAIEAEKQQPVPAGASETPTPSPPTVGLPPMGITGPPGPGSKAPADKEEPKTQDSEDSPSSPAETTDAAPDKPAEDKPAEDKPAEDKPAESKQDNSPE
jgi:hypothetical protein